MAHLYRPLPTKLLQFSDWSSLPPSCLEEENVRGLEFNLPLQQHSGRNVAVYGRSKGLASGSYEPKTPWM